MWKLIQAFVLYLVCLGETSLWFGSGGIEVNGHPDWLGKGALHLLPVTNRVLYHVYVSLTEAVMGSLDHTV